MIAYSAPLSCPPALGNPRTPASRRNRRSPFASCRRRVTRSPFTHVPFLLPSSIKVSAAPERSNTQCSREARRLLSTMTQRRERPARVWRCVSWYSWPSYLIFSSPTNRYLNSRMPTEGRQPLPRVAVPEDRNGTSELFLHPRSAKDRIFCYFAPAGMARHRSGRRGTAHAAGPHRARGAAG